MFELFVASVEITHEIENLEAAKQELEAMRPPEQEPPASDACPYCGATQDVAANDMVRLPGNNRAEQEMRCGWCGHAWCTTYIRVMETPLD